ncbi:MAG: hypothetical protein U0R49_07565 [Fimbriimonadales bacterium]
MIAFLAVAGAVLDDANWAGGGSAGSFAPNPQVQMVAEYVNIRLFKSNVVVYARFVFKNDGNATTVTMAFPDEGHASFGPAISRLVSKVDGTVVRTDRRPVRTNSHMGKAYVWLKKVSFEKGQTRVVEVDYVARGAHTAHGFYNYYTFVTGATWKGKIQRIECVVEWPQENNVGRPTFFAADKVDIVGDYKNIKLPPIQWMKNRAKLTWTNIEPNSVLYFHYVMGYWNFALNGKTLSPRYCDIDVDWLAIDRNGGDVLVNTGVVGGLFTDDSGNEWSYRALKRFGNDVRFVGRDRILLGNGRQIRLRRKLQTRRAHPREEYVYLQDLVSALGGRYRYDSSLDQVSITLPIK